MVGMFGLNYELVWCRINSSEDRRWLERVVDTDRVGHFGTAKVGVYPDNVQIDVPA